MAATAQPPAPRAGVEDLVRDLAVLTAMNNLMAQTAFLTVERLRISTEVVDETVSSEFGADLYERHERLVRASEDLILGLLDKAGARDERAALVQDLIAMRRQFKDRTRKPMEQRRLLESMERMYR